MDTNLLKHFPKDKTPREIQEKLLKQIQSALKTDKKFVVVNAPTGLGKSVVAATLANASEEPTFDFKTFVDTYQIWTEDGEEKAYEYPKYGAAVLTVTKNLQDQYTKDFEDLHLLKGKTNYICEYDNQFDVENAPCIDQQALKKQCWACNRCTYYEDRNKSLSNKFGVFNYDVWLNLKPHARRKEILICDESSELEEVLVSHFSLELDYNSLEKHLEIKKYPRLDKEDRDGHKWLLTLFERVKETIEDNKEILENPNHPKYRKTKGHQKYLTRLQLNISKVLDNWGENGENSNSVEYIVEKIMPDKFNKNLKEGLTFVPFRVNKLAKHLFNTVDKVVMLSATIIDHKKEMMDLGVSRDDYVYIEAPSVFPPEQSPIYIIDKYPLTYQVMDQNLPKVITILDRILEKHKDDKGLVHTVSFKITKAVEEGINTDRFIIRDGVKTNEVMLKEHSETTNPTVLVSPSMSHGVDLKGDLGKFQVIMKVPYLPLSNKRIKRLSKEDYTWYANKTLSTIVQMAGRCTRNETDRAVTYIVDGAVKGLIQRGWKKLPKYFKDRIK
jgi:ATP-dependent DNA helicase DinG